MMKVMNDKQQLREDYKRRLEALSPGAYRHKSDTICNKLCALNEYHNATTVFCYMATTLEVDTSKLIKRVLADGKTLVVPRIEGEAIVPHQIASTTELIPGPFDILHPKSNSPTIDAGRLDLVVVPGLAFTKGGVRLGRGGGYFDRWLPLLSAHIPTIGLAFDFQIADTLPEQAHDIRVSRVISA